MARLLLSLKAVFCGLVFIAGCGEKFYPVSGTVTIDGQPFANGAVTIVPEKGGAPSFGGTDAGGNFKLETGKTAGVRPGGYKVTLQKFTSPNLPKGDDEGRNIPEGFVPKSLVPELFTKPESTPARIDVPSGDGNYRIELKTK